MLRIYDANNQKTAIQFADYVIARLPFQAQTVQTDNGAEFQSAFHWHLLDRGIRHRYIKPATLRLNGKVERSHRIGAEEFYRLLDGVMIDDTKLFNDKLAEWENFYNYHRPHGGLGGQTPYERLKQKTQAPVKRSTSAAHHRQPVRHDRQVVNGKPGDYPITDIVHWNLEAPLPGRTTTTSIPRGVPTTPRPRPSLSPPRARCP